MGRDIGVVHCLSQDGKLTLVKVEWTSKHRGRRHSSGSCL